MTEVASFEDFRESWLDSVREGTPTAVQLGHRFAHKIVSQWLDLDEESLEVFYCDGSGDGGIDIAVLERAGPTSADEQPDGDTWYLIQSKYGSAFSGDVTLLAEGKKVIDTLDGKRQLSSLSDALLEKLTNFRKAATEHDQIRLVYATIDPLTPDQQSTLDDVRAMGRSRLGTLFEIGAVSIRTIYDNQMEEAELSARRQLTVRLDGHLAEAGSNLLVGSVSLIALHAFLKAYRSQTGNLDQLFEKNVRRFLGGRVKVNKGMQVTLREKPEQFGLFNNGITVTVSDFRVVGHGAYELVEPYVVNGCQTTRTIWEVLSNRLDAGGSGKSEEIEAWRARAENGCVVTKIAKVGSDGEALLQDITRYTNSQNAVREKDFISIDQGFKGWHRTLAEKFDLYLEIQRGGWDSQRAIQKQDPTGPQFTRAASALDLIKVYGAGWLAEPGLAFGKNPPFLPNGSVFSRIIVQREGERIFGARDLYAAYLLLEAGRRKGFGRGGETSRRQTKFLYYFVFINLLRDALEKEHLPAMNEHISDAVVRLLDRTTEAGIELENMAAELIDSYYTESDENSVFHDPRYRGAFGQDMNAFLKWEKLGRNIDQTEGLQAQLVFHKKFMGQAKPGYMNLRKKIASELGSAPGLK
jgi:hypothetical protein